MKLTIVTGASKGLGAALVKKLVFNRHDVIGLASSAIENWEIHDVEGFLPIQVDLSDSTQLEAVWEDIRNQITPDSHTSVTLIQNAGILEPMNLMGQVEDAMAFEKGLKVNLLAPMILMNAFMRDFQDWKGEKRIMNISSGAGRKPYAGWGMYCSSKSGIDMISQVAAVEQKDKDYPFQIASIAPGVIDTGMQNLIRTKTVDEFPPIARFHQLKEEGKLWSPNHAANLLVNYLESPYFGEEPLFDIRSWEKK